MRSHRDLIAVIFLLMAFVVGGLLLGGRGAATGRSGSKEDTPNPSITNNRASGSLGAWQWVQRQGYQPVAWRQNWTALDRSRPDVLLIIDPQVQEPFATLTGGGSESSDRTQLASRDAADLKRWLGAGQGHTAILLSSRIGSGSSGPSASANHDEETFGDALDLVVESASPTTNQAEFAPLQPVWDTQGILSLHSEGGARIKRVAADGIALFGDSAGSLALAIPVGHGRLIAVADGEVFSNRGLARSENALLLANLLAHYARPGGRVLFDEYHHGDVSDGDTVSVWASLGRPLQLATIQLCLALLGLLVILAVRFGPPVPLVSGQTRTSAEYVGSLASLYRRAQASSTALETLYRQFLRDVCARLALPPDVNLERLAEVASKRGYTDKERLRRLLAACEMRLDEGKLSEQELLDLTQQMDRVRKDMGIA